MDKNIELIVGDKAFNLTQGDIKALDSDFLNKLIDPESPFRKPEANVYTVYDADPKYFEAFLQILKQGSIPVLALQKEDEKQEQLQQEADFWGVRDRIERFLSVEAPSAARVIQRAFHLSKICVLHDLEMSDVQMRGRGSEPIFVPCCVCGTRWGYTEDVLCELVTCKLPRFWYVCEKCGDRRPEIGMGEFYCPHGGGNRFVACFRCKGTCTDKPLRRHPSVHDWTTNFGLSN